MVELQLNKPDYVSYEPVKAVVTAYNRTGRDIVLGGRGATGWLTFSVTAGGNSMVVPTGAHPHAPPAVLRSGKSITHTVSLGKYFAISTPRNYSIRAGAYYKNEVFYSRPKRVTISEGHVIWQQVAGVPLGQGGSGSYRRYQLLTYRSSRRQDLYIRVRDEKSSRVYATYSLGRIIRVRDPQATVDGQNQLHVLYMEAPKTYSHVTIAITGHTLSREKYREFGGSVPKLMSTRAGEVNVEGGMPFDPEAARAANLALDSIRKLSERPPGFLVE
jgi:hypothetical protein